MRRRTAAALFFGGAIGLSSIGYTLAPPADALPVFRHEITGFAAQYACTPDAGLDWTFTSANAGSHTIVHADFNRRVDLISQTGTQVVVHSAEKPGPTSLSITVTWDDAHVSHFTASTVMLDGVCPPPPTFPPTTEAPPSTSTSLSTTVPPATTSVTSADSGSTTTAPRAPSSTTATTLSVRPPGTPTSLPSSLPATGSSDTAPLVVVGVAFVLVGVALVAVRRRWVG